MSKELEYAIKNVETYLRAKHCDLSSFNIIKQALTPPTEKEVCEALSEFMNEPVWFDENNDIRISTQWLVKKLNTYGLDFMIVLPPHLITMVSRFFERKFK